MVPAHLPLLLDHCLAGLYVLSGDRIVWLNARAAEMVGCTAEELVGGSFLQFIHPPDLPLVRSKTGSADPYVVRAVRRDGELVHLEVHQRTVEKDGQRSEEHTSELQSLAYLVCRLLLEKKKIVNN